MWAALLAAARGLARGVVLLVPAQAGLPVAEYGANHIKKSVVGAGHAEKISGRFRSTGYVPLFINEFYALGLIKPGEAF